MSDVSPLADAAIDDWVAHWDDYAEAAEHNPASAYRRRIIVRELARLGVGRDTRVLDIGSGQGDLVRDVTQKWPTASVLGVELSPVGTRIASEKVPGAMFRQVDLLDDDDAPPPEYAAWATRAVCAEVLEHVDDPLKLLTNARRWLADGCRIVVTVPGGPMSAFDRSIGHRRHYTLDTLRALLDSGGITVDRLYGAGFPFLNLYRLVVVARGEKLREDAAGGRRGAMPVAARAAMLAFGALFHGTIDRTPWGWHLVATGRLRGGIGMPER